MQDANIYMVKSNTALCIYYVLPGIYCIIIFVRFQKLVCLDTYYSVCIVWLDTYIIKNMHYEKNNEELYVHNIIPGREWKFLACYLCTCVCGRIWAQLATIML